MDVALNTATTFNPTNLSSASVVEGNTVSVSPEVEANDLVFELGLWLSGLESFLNIRNHSFVEEHRAKAALRDWTKEFRLTHSTLLLCSRLTFQFSRQIKEQAFATEIDADEIYQLSNALKDAVLLNEGLLRAAPLRFGEWTAWSNFLADKFKAVEAFAKLIKSAEKTGEAFLPALFWQLLESKPMSPVMEADLRLVLPRFAKILKWLSVIEKMLRNDEPLKPSLLIFSRIYEQIQDMMTYINNRLLRFPNEEDELFCALDGAAYTASIELRKVYNYELAGVAEIRPTPSVYAKLETAYALLNDSFQQTVISFAILLDPNVEPMKLFPNFQSKLDNSLLLRQSLWQVLQGVKNAERNPETYPMNSLHQQLNDFLASTLQYLFYKDMETVERFIEEVLITTNNKDLVPILHRFGAYLETLFGQVNMRVVLAKHPFQERRWTDEKV